MNLFRRSSRGATATLEAPTTTRADMVKQLVDLRAHTASETTRLRTEEAEAFAAFEEAKAVHDAALVALRTVRGELQSVSWHDADHGRVLERRLQASAPPALQSSLADVKQAYRDTIDGDWQTDSKMTSAELIEYRKKLQSAEAALEALALLDIGDADLEARIAAIAVGVAG